MGAVADDLRRLGPSGENDVVKCSLLPTSTFSKRRAGNADKPNTKVPPNGDGNGGPEWARCVTRTPRAQCTPTTSRPMASMTC
eukprot:2225941-Lingulodinium_polyedra.AAC.1